MAKCMVVMAASSAAATSSISSDITWKKFTMGRLVMAWALLSRGRSCGRSPQRSCDLSQVIRHRLGMNRYPMNFGALQLEAVFESGDGLMDAPHRQIVGKRAMARDRNVFASAAHRN